MRAKVLILGYARFVDPLPGPITFRSEVHGTWLNALDYIANARNMEQWEENIKIPSGPR